MLDIVFSDSAWASLKQAHGGAKGKTLGSFGISVRHSDGKKPDKKEIKAVLHGVKAKMRQAWGAVPPLNGDPAEVYGFGLFFSIGDISENIPGPGRQRVLEWLWSIYPEMDTQTIERLVHRAQQTLETVLNRWTAGERLRIWYSDYPDEICGIHWLMHHLMQRKKDGGGITLVRLPEGEGDGEAPEAKKTNWGQVSPWEWHTYLSQQTEASPSFCQSSAERWRVLQQENAPLRAVQNGQLVSAAEAMYDPIILREISEESTTFHEAQLIGRILGKYSLGVGDAWIALRIEEMIRQGLLSPVSHSPADSPLYHRMLTKLGQ